MASYPVPHGIGSSGLTSPTGLSLPSGSELMLLRKEIRKRLVAHCAVGQTPGEEEGG